MNKILFDLKYVYRNVTRNFFRTLSLFLSIFMLSFIIITAFTVKNALSDGYYMYEDVRNENVDITITFDSKSSSYLINSNKIKKITSVLDYYGGFFEMSVLTESKEEQLSIMLMAGTSEELEKFISQDLNHLQYNEAIINKTTSNNLKVQVGDTLNLYIGSIPYSYNIVNIVEDRSIFEGNKILVQKDFYFKTYAKDVLGMDIDEYSDIDICTSIYLNLKDGYTKEQVITLLKGSKYYPNSIVQDPRGYNEMKADVKMGTGVMYAALFIFIAALLFVLISIINLRIKSFKNEVGIVETLGESKTYIFRIVFLEIIILSLVSLLLAYLLNNYIYTKEFSILSTRGTYHHKYRVIDFIGTYFSVLLICGLTLASGYKKYNKLTAIDLARNKQYDHVISFKKLIIINSILIVLNILESLFLDKIVPLMISSIIGIFLNVSLGIMLVSLIVKIICGIFNSDKVYKMTFSRSLAINRIKHNSLKILLVCLFGIIMCCIVIENIEYTLKHVENNLNIDNIFISPKGVDQEVVEDIKKYDAVEGATLGFFEDKVTTQDEKYTFLIVFSCDVLETKNLMGFNVPEDYLSKFQSKGNYVVVMDDFLVAANLKPGDKITFKMSTGLKTYEILCGADLPFQQFAYTNDFYHEDVFFNTVLINNKLNDQTLMTEFRKSITSEYGNEITMLYDAGTYLKAFFARARIALDLVYAVILIIIVCFIVSIINNTILSFKEIENDLATLQILGISPMGLNKMIIIEMFISFLSILISLVLMVYGVSTRFGGLSLLCGYYLDLFIKFKTVLLAGILGIGCFVVSYIYYFIGIRKINVCEQLKK